MAPFNRVNTSGGTATPRLLPARTMVVVAALASTAHAEMSAEELAKLAQSPVRNLVSIPIQYDTTTWYGLTTRPDGRSVCRRRSCSRSDS